MMFWNGFTIGCLLTIAVEAVGIFVYAFKKGGKK